VSGYQLSVKIILNKQMHKSDEEGHEISDDKKTKLYD